MEAAGNLQTNVAGGTALLLGDKPLSDAFVKSGNDLTKFGQRIGNGVVDTKNWNDTMSLVDKAQGFEKLGVMAGRIMDGNSGLSRQVQVELKQELPGLFLGGGTVKGIMLASGAMEVGETAGNAALDAYQADIDAGKSHAQALSSARVAGGTAAMTEAALQLTLGKLADFGAGKIGNVAGKAGFKIGTEGLIEGAQEGGASLAVNAALGQELNVNKALTQTVGGMAVGKGTAVATAPADIAQDISQTGVTSNTGGGRPPPGGGSPGTADLGVIGSVTPGADKVTGADLGAIGAVTPGADVIADLQAAGLTQDNAGVTLTNDVVSQAQQNMADLGLNVSDETATSLATKIENATKANATADTKADVISELQAAGLTETKANNLADVLADTSAEFMDAFAKARVNTSPTVSAINANISLMWVNDFYTIVEPNLYPI